MALPADLNLGTAPNNGTGDSLRLGGQKIKTNLEYLDQLSENKLDKGGNTADTAQSLRNDIDDRIPNAALNDYENISSQELVDLNSEIMDFYQRVLDDGGQIDGYLGAGDFVTGEGNFGHIIRNIEIVDGKIVHIELDFLKVGEIPPIPASKIIGFQDSKIHTQTLTKTDSQIFSLDFEPTRFLMVHGKIPLFEGNHYTYTANDITIIPDMETGEKVKIVYER